jgi:hypothetical protein
MKKWLKWLIPGENVGEDEHLFSKKTKVIKPRFNYGLTSFRFLHFLIKSIALGIFALVFTYLAIQNYDVIISKKISNIIWIILLSFWAILFAGYIYGITNSEIRITSPKNNNQLGKAHCPKCGKKIDDDSKYCIYCGSKI